MEELKTKRPSEGKATDAAVESVDVDRTLIKMRADVMRLADEFNRWAGRQSDFFLDGQYSDDRKTIAGNLDDVKALLLDLVLGKLSYECGGFE